MIPRYTTEEMGRIWSEENRLKCMLDVELAVCEVLAEDGVIPPADMEDIRSKAGFDIERIREIEKVTRHDVAAFVKDVGERIGRAGRFIHYGLTSSDVLDTATGIQMKEAFDVILEAAAVLEGVLAKQAVRYKDLPMMGRTHGVHAEPLTLGFKLAVFVAEMRRNLDRLKRAREVVAVGKISGAVGTFANVPPSVEERVCARLGLSFAPVSTQIVQRDRHAEALTALAVCGCTLERLALEIRHLHRTEVKECEEPFRKGQRGSSAMPHKKNPIVCERICGMARLLRANALAAMENVALWHERDISHSSVERVIFPDSTTLLHYMLLKMKDVVENLVVYPENMERNLRMNRGTVFSQRLLLKLIDKGLSRDEAYLIVQRNAMKATREEREFVDVLREDEELMGLLSAGELESLFDLSVHLRHVETVFRRLGLG